MEETQLPVVVIGAGPVGLSAAVRLVERSVDFVLLEASTSVAASLRDWGHVRLFSPWRYDVDAAAARLLEPTGWTPPPPEEYPTGDDLFRRYLEPLSKVPAIRRGLRLDRRVVAITRRGVDKIRTADRASVPLLVRTQSNDGAHEEFLRAR
ncbi:MAG: FAD-dependent oxidoreductase [Polyangiaceae bacterium]